MDRLRPRARAEPSPLGRPVRHLLRVRDAAAAVRRRARPAGLRGGRRLDADRGAGRRQRGARGDLDGAARHSRPERRALPPRLRSRGRAPPPRRGRLPGSGGVSGRDPGHHRPRLRSRHPRPAAREPRGGRAAGDPRLRDPLHPPRERRLARPLGHLLDRRLPVAQRLPGDPPRHRAAQQLRWLGERGLRRRHRRGRRHCRRGGRPGGVQDVRRLRGQARGGHPAPPTGPPWLDRLPRNSGSGRAKPVLTRPVAARRQPENLSEKPQPDPRLSHRPANFALPGP